MSFDPVTKLPNGGYLYHLQRAMSERGGFNIIYKVVRNSSEFRSTTEFVDYVLRHSNIDIFGGTPVTDTMERRDAYLQFAGKVVDASIIMVSPGFVQVPFILWTFALPFDNTVWIVVMSIVVANALIFYVVERLHLHLKDADEYNPDDPPLPLYMAFYVSLIQYTGQEPQTQAKAPASKVISLGYHFFLFVVLAAYLANQAAVLVAPKQVTTKALSLQGTAHAVLRFITSCLHTFFLSLVCLLSPSSPPSLDSPPSRLSLLVVRLPVLHRTPPDALNKNIPICALTGPAAWCQDCDAGSGSAYSVVRASYPTLNLVGVSSNDPVVLVDAVQKGVCGGTL